MKPVTLRQSGLFAAVLSVSSAAVAPAIVHAAPPATATKTVIPATKPKTAGKTKLPENVAARVNGHDITRDDVLAVINMMSGHDTVRTLVNVVTLETEAKRLGVKFTDIELEDTIKDLKNRYVQREMQNGGPPATYAEIAEKYGISEEYLRYSSQIDILRRKTFLKAMEAQVQPLDTEIRIEHILIATVPVGGSQAQTNSPADQKQKDTAAKTKIDAIRADIVSGKISFEEAAKKNSDDSANAANGGMLDWVGHNLLDHDFETAAFSLKKPGDISQPIKSQFGWHLVKLVALGKDAPPAERKAYHDKQVAQIAQQANDQRVLENWFQTLLQSAKVDVNPSIKLLPKAPSAIASLFPAPIKTPLSAHRVARVDTVAEMRPPSLPPADIKGMKPIVGGLMYQDVVAGTGAEVKPGDAASVQYTGTLTNGTKFDSSYDHGGQPFTFTLGAGEVIKGWDLGVAGMKIGGKRKLVIPPALAYGPGGQGPIPPNATLVFTVELVSIQPPAGQTPAPPAQPAPATPPTTPAQ